MHSEYCQRKRIEWGFLKCTMEKRYMSDPLQKGVGASGKYLRSRIKRYHVGTIMEKWKNSAEVSVRWCASCPEYYL